jgi:uncharacterized DUF497 family protein
VTLDAPCSVAIYVDGPLNFVYTKMMFEWDAEKDRRNLIKRGVSFDEAATAFGDPMGLDGLDVAHSIDEFRYLRVAASTLGHILTIAYTVRSQAHGTQKIRIISARKASRKEKRAYQET